MNQFKLLSLFLVFTVLNSVQCTPNEFMPHTDLYRVQNRFVGYAYAADNVLGGNISDSALDELMDFFSSYELDFVWGDIRNQGGLSYSQVRNQYKDLALNVYAGFSRHFIQSSNITPYLKYGRQCYHTSTYLLEVSILKVYGNNNGTFTPVSPTGIQILGKYENDWVIDPDGQLRMFKFLAGSDKIFPVSNFPVNGVFLN